MSARPITFLPTSNDLSTRPIELYGQRAPPTSMSAASHTRARPMYGVFSGVVLSTAVTGSPPSLLVEAGWLIGRTQTTLVLSVSVNVLEAMIPVLESLASTRSMSGVLGRVLARCRENK